MRSVASHGTGAKLQMVEPAPSGGGSVPGVYRHAFVPKDFFSRQPTVLCSARTQVVAGD